MVKGDSVLLVAGVAYLGYPNMVPAVQGFRECSIRPAILRDGPDTEGRVLVEFTLDSRPVLRASSFEELALKAAALGEPYFWCESGWKRTTSNRWDAGPNFFGGSRETLVERDISRLEFPA